MPKYKDEMHNYADQLKNTVFEELATLRDELDDMLEEGFRNDFDALLDAMFSHYTQRNDMGNFVPMTEAEYQDIRNKYAALQSDYQQLSPEARQNEQMKTLGSALVRDGNALSGLSVDSLPPLAEVLHGTQIPTVQMYTEGKTVGDMVSSREAVEYTGKDGRVYQGFFTAEDVNFPKSQGDANRQLLEELTAKYPKFKKTLRAAFGDMAYRNIIRDDNKLERYVPTTPWMRRLSEKNKTEFRKIFKELNDGLKKNSARYTVARENQIRPDAKMAQRSSAMSDVARALGFPELLANSQRVIVERNGQKIEGTMMEMAGPDGVDRARLQADSPLFRVEEKDFNNPDMLKSLANLQILDFLCANTDRHSNNFFVRFDTSDPEHPKVIGVQGIDNDNSFGALEDGKLRMAKAENLKVITPEMKDAVQRLTAESLGALLEDYGMDAAEIDAAKSRLNTLHELIRNGENQNELQFVQENGNEILTNPKNSIHIVKEDEWGKLTCQKLLPEIFIDQNIFTMIGKVTRSLQNDKERTLNKAVQNGKENGLHFSRQNENTAFENIRQALQKEYQQLKEIEKRLDEKGNYANGTNGSWQFNNTGKSVKWLVGRYEKLLDNLSDRTELDNKAQKQLDSFYNILKLNKQKILDVADTYINKDKVHIFRQGKERLQVAKDLKKFIQDGVQASEKLFAAQKKEKEQWAQKSAYEVSAYASNQLRSMMEGALRENVLALKASDAMRALGLKAMKAQNRLWNFSQRPAASGNAENQISAAQLSAMEDINTLTTFVKAQNPEANVPDIQNPVTAKQARSFLGAVFEQEMKLVNERNPIKENKVTKAKEAEDEKIISSGGRKL